MRNGSAAAGFLEQIYGYRYALGALIVILVAACAWFQDDLATMWQSKPTVADIEGSWTYDAARFDAMINAEIGNQMPADLAKAYRRDALAVAAGYKGVVYAFGPESYAVRRHGLMKEYPCIYAVVSNRQIRVQLAGKSESNAMFLLIDEPQVAISIRDKVLTIPLARVE